jgi:two-component sensor histidine kinase
MAQRMPWWKSFRRSQSVAVAVAAGLLLAGVAMAVYNDVLAGQQQQRQVAAQAAILARSVSAALAFDDRAAAREYVDALSANSELQAAGVYDESGRLVASFAKPGMSLPPTARAGPGLSAGGDLVVSVPVVQRGERLGVVYLRAIREPFVRRALRFGGIVLLIVMASLVVAIFGASNASLIEAHGKLEQEMSEREKTEAALLESQRNEAEAQLAVATERGRAALRQSEQQLAFALRAGRLGSWELNLKTGRLAASDEFRANLGVGPSDRLNRYAGLLALVHPDDRERFEHAVDEAIDRGADLDIEFRTLKPDEKVGWVLVRGRALADGDGAPKRLAGVSLDITARKATEGQMRLLLDELNHRVKNTLATVQSVAMQTRRNTLDPAAFSEAFVARLGALARAHELLSAASWEGASLAEVVRRTLAPHMGGADQGRVSVSGPPISLGPNAAVTLNMVFHELATNAGKYGALSVPGGHVVVDWSIEEGAQSRFVRIDWRESGGPPVAEPVRRGFGSRLIEQGLVREFDGEAKLSFHPEGLSCLIRLPISGKLRAAA